MFHQCQAGMDYPKKCSNRLMFDSKKNECNWEDQVDCSGKEKLIGKFIKSNLFMRIFTWNLNLTETNGLEDQSKPDVSADGKGRVTKFCMERNNGNYEDLYYVNILNIFKRLLFIIF